MDEEPRIAVRQSADYRCLEGAGHCVAGGAASVGLVLSVADKCKHAMDYGKAGAVAYLGENAVAFLSTSAEVEFSLWRLPAQCVWFTVVRLAAVEELVRPYGDETCCLEGPRIFRRE